MRVIANCKQVALNNFHKSGILRTLMHICYAIDNEICKNYAVHVVLPRVYMMILMDMCCCLDHYKLIVGRDHLNI